ncbi:MAG: uncharacterized protein KVP18_000961 [Porospora cf. gigantea A]|uniref:uncharacterized protein n=1 Tax=Porospora cf. gigantea A TaxID=2853593 RepID=UPI00355A2896|nr:MAG: hypothetical protein KVP18_000961 [Porospora cf. gigantea A]
MLEPSRSYRLSQALNFVSWTPAYGKTSKHQQSQSPSEVVPLGICCLGQHFFLLLYFYSLGCLEAATADLITGQLVVKSMSTGLSTVDEDGCPLWADLQGVVSSFATKNRAALFFVATSWSARILTVETDTQFQFSCWDVCDTTMASEMSPPPNDDDMCDVVTLKDLFLVRDAPLKVAFTDKMGTLSVLTLHHPAFEDYYVIEERNWAVPNFGLRHQRIHEDCRV